MTLRQTDEQAMILMEQVQFAYADQPEGSKPVLRDVSVRIPVGSHTAILGPNGSGKSTFARLCNALELPDSGEIRINGIAPDSLEAIYRIRQCSGMVFQNPDNQIVGTTVEEDTAFGPENLGLETEEIAARVDFALQRVGLAEMRYRSPNALSGGQKQKLGIAGALAMKPRCLILDEATAMLDPQAAEQFMSFVSSICREEGLTLIQITHDMEEALDADQLLVLVDGRIRKNAGPEEIFTDEALLEEAELQAPAYLSLFYRLRARYGQLFPEKAGFHEDEILQAVASVLNKHSVSQAEQKSSESWEERFGQQEKVIEIEGLSYTYQAKQSNPHRALSDVAMDVRRGEIFALCGHSGSGKSTLITHLNGLFRPQSGKVTVLGRDAGDPKQLSAIRRQTGLVFQYPEYQLFETTIRRDIAYGPEQMGLSPEEVEKRVNEALELVQLDAETADSSPFECSGGQRRRAAIAGVLAMNPDILVLDEPAAGLDPQGRRVMMRHIANLRERGKTIIMVTHNMDEAAALADRIGVMAEGRLIAVRTPLEVFTDAELLTMSGLKKPKLLAFAEELNRRCGTAFAFLSEEEAMTQLSAVLDEEAANV